MQPQPPTSNFPWSMLGGCRPSVTPPCGSRRRSTLWTVRLPDGTLCAVSDRVPLIGALGPLSNPKIHSGRRRPGTPSAAGLSTPLTLSDSEFLLISWLLVLPLHIFGSPKSNIVSIWKFTVACLSSATAIPLRSPNNLLQNEKYPSWVLIAPPAC